MAKRNLKKSLLALVLVVVVLLSQAMVYAASGPQKRSEIPEKYKWKLEDIYATTDAWKADFQKVQNEYIPEMAKYKGKLTDANTLLKCLQLRDDMMILNDKVYVYASMKSDEDNANNDATENKSKVETLNSQVAEAVAFIQPELLGQSEDVIKGYLNNPALADYKHSIDALLKQKAHTLSKSEEELLAKASILAGTPNEVYSKAKAADMTFNKIKNENGNWVQVTNASYGSFLENKSRTVRKSAFDAVYRQYDKLKNTFASTLAAEVKKNIFFAQARKYDSAMEASLSAENIPVSVYDNLVKSVNDNAKYLHKYVELRKKVLGLDKVHLYDMYVPLIESYEMKVPYEDGKKTILEALKPLGQDYLNNFQKGLDSRWIDVYETDNKYAGAYQWGSYTTHPFVLANYDDTYDAMSTIAHEMGHALNSVYANNAQKYINSNVPIFNAEVASTANEMLLSNYSIKNAKSDEEKLYLINSLVENIRGTVYTQVMYSEFEKTIHERVEKGDALSAKTFRDIWGELMKKYYGDEFVVDDYSTLWWARIPHFYMNFYVYKYATSMAASNEIVKQIETEGQPAIDRYLEFLKAGSSDYPIELLKKSGVDMTKTTAVDNLLAYFGQLVDQMEEILKKEGKLK